jgi:type II secretory pathway pseudopilin PulG
VIQGDYDIKFYMYDNCPDPPGKAVPKSNDTFLFRVKQFNRNPEIALSEENRTFVVKEDTPTYFEGVYDWFVDPDIEDGYAPDLLNISMRSFKSDTYVTSSVLETDKKIMEVYLKNGSAANPHDWSLLVVPAANFHSKENEYFMITLRAYDGVLKTNPNLKISVFIASQNDEPVIPVQKRFENDDDWEFTLTQGDRTTSFLMEAFDTADGQTPYLEYFFEYEDPADEEWLTISRQGTVSWFPKNEHVGPHKVTLWVSDSHDNVSQELWFNVTNINDRPKFVSISNGTTEITDIPRFIQQRYEFIVREHEEFNLTIIASDLDAMIGLQDRVNFKCNLTQLNNTYLNVDEDDPFKAYFHFWAEKKFGYFATFEPSNPPIETEIIISDQDDGDIIMVLPLRIIIENVNDPPVLVEIDTPEEGFYSPILYNVEFSAGNAFDPDTVYNDTLTYQWDFDATDGPFKAEFTGLNGKWDFPTAGSYMITLRIVDSAGNYIEAYRNIIVDGIRDDDDYDNDGMPNKWEDENGFDKYDPSDAEGDADGDKLTNIEEFLNLTDPRKLDSDGDGSNDKDDYAPLDSTVWEKPVEDEKWTDDAGNIILIVIIAVVIILLLLAITGFFLYRSMQKSKEEEERRKQAEAMQQSMYEGQDLYENLPAVEEGTTSGAVAPAPDTPQLPPQEGEGLDDIFGGAGTLPTAEGAPESLPPGPDGSQVGDVTELLDQ